MRHILISSILLSLPLAALAQEEPQPTQSQYGQDEQPTQQSQDMRAQPVEQQQDQTQSQQTMQQSERTGQEMETQQSGGAEPQVDRAQFTSEVQNREPVDEVSEFEAAQEPLYFFTEVKDAAGQTITHRWKHDDEVMAEVPLQVGSDSWRTWSSKEFIPEWEGEWTVEVVDAEGNTLTEESITVKASEQLQNVGYSPEEQTQDSRQQQTQDETGAQSEQIEYQPETQSQDTQSQDDTQQQMDDQSAEPEQIEYQPETQETQETQSQDDMQQQEGEQDTSGEDW